VEPFEVCTGCGRGDTPTVYAVEGDAEFHAGAHAYVFGKSVEAANEFIEAWIVDTFGPGKAPVGEFVVLVRLCAECSERLGMPVGPADADTLPGLRQIDFEGGPQWN